MNSLKGASPRRMRQEYPDLRRHYWRANRLWSGSYFAGSATAFTTSLKAGALAAILVAF